MMPQRPPNRTLGAAIGLAYAVVGLTVAGYIITRAIRVPLTYDEGVIYVRYVTGSWPSLFEVGAGTNHFLNTVLTKVSTTVFGTAPWALRVPNVLAGIAYLWTASAITRRVAHPVIGLAGFVLLVAHPFLDDYFAVSRGYGLAIALQTGGTYYLLRWLDVAPASRGARRDLARAVWLAVVAVAASFTVLPAALALVAVVFVRLLWAATEADRAPTPPARAWSSYWRWAIVWLLVTGTFTTMVFSRDRALSEALFAPVAVRVTGLFEDELADIQVLREDATGRLRPLTREAGGVWRTEAVRAAWGLRVELPVAMDRNLARLDAAIGPDVFTRTRRDPGPWMVRDVGASRVLVATGAVRARSAADGMFGAINWLGDGVHRRLVLSYAAIVLAGLAALGVLAALVFNAIGRLGRLRRDDAWLLLSALMSLASLCAAPVYLLRRNNQLYFGGATGLLHDTFGSIVAGIMYTVPEWPGQGRWAGLVLAAGAATLVLAALLGGRRRAALVAPAALAGIVGIVATQIVLQHLLVGTPYLTARTALFLLPLLTLYVVVLADTLGGWGRARLAVVGVVVVGLAVASVWHTVGIANVSRSRDVPADAATPQMLRAVAEAAAANTAPPVEVRVGVEWMFYPVATYYAARQSTPTTRYVVHVLPGDGVDVDYIYGMRRSDLGAGAELRAYPEVGAVLWRARRPGAR